MKNLKLIIIILLYFLMSAFTSSVKEADSSVVRILNKTADGAGMGTGFVINDDGYIITNHHVIEDTEALIIVDSGALKPAQVIWQSAAQDLAILQAPAVQRPSLKIASIEPEKGSTAYAIGFPGAADMLYREDMQAALNSESTITSGSISRIITRDWQGGESFRTIQHSASVNPGNSGGPLLNGCGEVVGVNTLSGSAIDDQRQHLVIDGIFWASHASILLEVLENKSIGHETSNQACTINSGTVTSSPMQIWLLFLIGIVAIFAAMMSLRRPREQVVQVVETYSQWIRRKGNNSTPPQPIKDNHSVVSPSPRKETKQLSLVGHDSNGTAINISFAQAKLYQEGITIGRSSKLCDVVIKDNTLSRRHAQLYVDKHTNQIYLEDLNSANGSTVENEALKPFSVHALTLGTNFKLGNVRVMLKA